jgi:hypothetical protein
MANLKFRISVTNISDAINSISSTCRFINTQVLYLVFDNNEESEQINCAIASGSESGNITIINIKGIMDYTKPFNIIPLDVNKFTSIIKNCDGIFLTIQIPETKNLISITNDSNKFSMSKVNLYTGWIQTILNNNFTKFHDCETPVEITLQNDDFADIKNAATNKFSDTISNKDVVFVVLSKEKLTLFRHTGSIISFIKQKINIKQMSETLQILSFAIPCSTATSMIDPFIRSKLSDNTVTIYNKFVKIVKDDNSGMCIFMRDLSQKIPLAGIRTLIDNSNIMCSLNITLDKYKKFVGVITSLVENVNQPIDLEINTINNEWIMSSSHATSISQTQSSMKINPFFYNENKINITKDCNDGSFLISNVSPRKILNSVDFLKNLTQNIKNKSINDSFTIEGYRGPSFNNNNKSNDYLKIGTPEYFIIIACNLTSTFSVNFAQPINIAR